MRRECRERFSRHRLQRKPLVSDPGMHHGTCVTHVPWCMSGSLFSGGGGNVPGIPGACAPGILRIWQEAHGYILPLLMWLPWVKLVGMEAMIKSYCLRVMLMSSGKLRDTRIHDFVFHIAQICDITHFLHALPSWITGDKESLSMIDIHYQFIILGYNRSAKWVVDVLLSTSSCVPWRRTFEATIPIINGHHVAQQWKYNAKPLRLRIILGFKWWIFTSIEWD